MAITYFCFNSKHISFGHQVKAFFIAPNFVYQACYKESTKNGDCSQLFQFRAQEVLCPKSVLSYYCIYLEDGVMASKF